MNFVKYLLFSALLVALTVCTVQSQNPELPNRYPVIELFTNTPCPSCVAQNPGFFTLMENYSDNAHLISFYPGQPYSTCPLYQDNTTENSFRTSYRDIFSTPRVSINGTSTRSSGSVNASHIDAVVAGTSFLGITVEETGGPNVSATVRLQTFDTPTITNGQLFVAAVEKDVHLTGIPGHWEEQHYAVFRKFQTPQEGMSVDLTQDDQTFTFDYTIDPEWDMSKVYLLAWVEDPDTKESLNSGTKFDPVVGSVDISKHVSVQVFPNPTVDRITVDLPSSFSLDNIEVTDISGKSVMITQESNEIDVSRLAGGSYFIIARSRDNTHVVSQFVKK